MREGQTLATNNGNVPRWSSTLSGAPNWLAAESVSATKCLPPRCKNESARAIPMPNNEKGPRTRLFRSARVCRMSQLLPGNRHDAQMWAQFSPLGGVPGKKRLAKTCKANSLTLSRALRALACRLRSNTDERTSSWVWLTVIPSSIAGTSRSARSEGCRG
jgi:hypothetical protein